MIKLELMRVQGHACSRKCAYYWKHNTKVLENNSGSQYIIKRLFKALEGLIRPLKGLIRPLRGL